MIVSFVPLMAKIKAHINGTKKDVILKNASLLFRKKGFKATSLRELAESLNIEAPSLYNHISSKSELLYDICFSVANDFTNHIESVLKSDVSPVNKITSLIKYHIQKSVSDFDNVYVSNHEWKHLQQKHVTQFLKFRKSYEQNFTLIIEEGINKKQLKSLDAQIAVLTILSALRGIEFLHNHIKNYDLELLEKNMADQLLLGIKNN